MSPEVARELTARRAAKELAVDVEYFAIERDGVWASHCELLHHDGVVQVDALLTAPAFQQHGLARSVLLAAVARAGQLGCTLVFLRTDADDWPQHFYERLGFNTVATLPSFTRTTK
jgi:GNAT superfamily N-acetyltransferase